MKTPATLLKGDGNIPRLIMNGYEIVNIMCYSDLNSNAINKNNGKKHNLSYNRQFTKVQKDHLFPRRKTNCTQVSQKFV